MPAVYVLSSGLDHNLTKPVIDRLQSLGYAVSTTGYGADAVLTLWTERARQSPKVHEESARAFDRQIYVQATLDGDAPPRPFEALPCANLGGERAAYGALEDAIARIVNERTPPAPLREVRFGVLSTPAVLGAPKLVLIATGAALAAFASALTAVQSSAIATSQLQIALSGVIGVCGLCAVLIGYRLWAIRRSGD
ncbi:MAG: hypothetical protein K2P58_02330 [Hyphomonadaceae bacterium]|nr:hypothetical protein [Hyphomonadaceae bacterium]